MMDLDAPDLRLDARLSPAQAIPPAALDPGRGTHTSAGKPRPGPWVYDGLLFYSSAPDQVVSAKISRALVEVRDGSLFKREGHARWNEYLRAFVPMPQRWCQDEMKRERRLEVLPGVAAAFTDGRLNKSRVRAILPVVTPQTEGEWLDRAMKHPVRDLEVLVKEEIARRVKEKDGAGEGTDPPESARG